MTLPRPNSPQDEIFLSHHKDQNYAGSILGGARIRFLEPKTGESFINRVYADPPDTSVHALYLRGSYVAGSITQ
jgi:hypothetical protein